METGKSNKMVTGATKGARQKAERNSYYIPEIDQTIEADSIEDARERAKIIQSKK